MKDLTSKGMLINLSISQWAGRKHDKSVSQEVASNHGTTADAGRYNKNVIAKKALEAIKKASNKARTFHYDNTLPWSLESIADELEKTLEAERLDLCNQIYKALEAEYDYLTSDEGVKEYLINNELWEEPETEAEPEPMRQAA